MSLYSQLFIFGLLCIVIGMIIGWFVEKKINIHSSPDIVGDVVFVNPDETVNENPKAYINFVVRPDTILQMKQITLNVIKVRADPRD